MKSFKTIITFIIVFFLVSCAGKEKVIEIGIISPMTGAGAACCDYWIDGLNLAVSELNEQGGNYKLIYEDCQSDARRAVDCYRFLEAKGVKYIIAVGGQFAMAVAPQTKGKEILYFTTSDYNDAVLKETDRCFRVYPSATTLANTMASFLRDSLKINLLSTVTINTTPNIMVRDYLIKKLDSSTSKILEKETFSIGQYDFKDIVAKISRTETQAVFFTGFGISANSFCNQLASQPKSQNIVITGDVNLSTETFKKNNKSNLRIYYADSKCGVEFREKFTETYKYQPNSLASCPYIIPFMIHEARIQANENNITSQLEYLRNREISTHIGPIKIEDDENTTIPMEVYKLN